MGSRVPTTLSQVRLGDDGCINEDTVSLDLPAPYDMDATLEMTAQAGVNPYSNGAASERTREPRRTLDDMRKLDAEIKQARALNWSAGNAVRAATKQKRPLRSVLARWLGTARS